jgi:ureidoglycolate lyase
MIHPLHVQPMTDAAFAPFGVLLAPSATVPPDYRDADSEGWRHVVDLDGTPELVVSRTRYVGRRFSRLERHLNVTQAFIPLGGVSAAVAVAPPTWSNAPDPDSVRAFVLAPGVGYLFHPGTWHSLDRYPLSEGSIAVVMLTTRETTDEAANVPKAVWKLTEEVDYLKDRGIEFELILGVP